MLHGRQQVVAALVESTETSMHQTLASRVTKSFKRTQTGMERGKCLRQSVQVVQLVAQSAPHLGRANCVVVVVELVERRLIRGNCLDVGIVGRCPIGRFDTVADGAFDFAGCLEVVREIGRMIGAPVGDGLQSLPYLTVQPTPSVDWDFAVHRLLHEGM
jgi:hypothetical protein